MIKNSEILLLYEAKLCNPNGDPDNENKPRIDYSTMTNLVSDVRLKRFIRDYLYHYKNKDIFIRKEKDGSYLDATERYKQVEEKLGKNDFLIDIKFFGAVIPIKGSDKKKSDKNQEKESDKKEKGSSIQFTGPIQFSWGYSLNKVELLDSSSITSHFAGEKKEGGSIGKDWRLKYSLIAFYGRINKYWAEKTNLNEDDIKLFDESIFPAINFETSTRSKIGHMPILYIRIEYSDDYMLGDLRRFINIDKKEGIESIKDYKINIDELLNVLERIKDKISKVVVKRADEISYLDENLKKFPNVNFI
jgi:CRISPR-associated protein Csh2